LHISKIRFLFLVSFTIEYKDGIFIAEFYLYMGFGADLFEKCDHQKLKATEIGIRTPLKSENYFRFVSQTVGVEATTSLSRLQNLVKIGKSFDNRSVHKHTDRKTDYWVYPMHCIF